jgi:ketosteroid isomerase-like protein
LVAALVGAGSAIAHAQGLPPHETRALIEAYYADYSAMSAAPTGPAMDRWVSHYAPFVFIEDPTLGQSGLGVDTIRKVYVDAFTGPMGPVRWDVRRRVASGDWVAVEGWLNGTQHGKPFRTRFSTWLKIRDGRIVHHVDYIDYQTIRRQIAGAELVRDAPKQTPHRDVALGSRDVERALRITDEFYRRYEAMPVVASAAGVARYVDLLTDGFTLDDATAGQRVDGRDRFQRVLNDLLAKGDYGALHWDIARRVTDGEWVAVEGTCRGIFKGRPFAMRFTTWLRVHGDKIAEQIDYVDYATFRRQVGETAAK